VGWWSTKGAALLLAAKTMCGHGAGDLPKRPSFLAGKKSKKGFIQKP
jgi:hypothetical protein